MAAPYLEPLINARTGTILAAHEGFLVNGVLGPDFHFTCRAHLGVGKTWGSEIDLRSLHVLWVEL